MAKQEAQKRLAKVIGEITRAIDAGTKENEKQRLFFTGEIDSLCKEIEAQTARRNAAAGKGDTDGFRAAAKSIVAAEIELRQYRETMTAIDKTPVITKDQAEAFMGELQAIQQEINSETAQEITGLASQIVKANDDAMKLQHDLIEMAQLLASYSSAITNGSTHLTCGKARLATIIGPTNEYPWRIIAEEVKRRTAR